MAIAYVQEFPASDDRSTTNYDAIKDKLNVESDPPEGVFRIFDVWESAEAHAAFLSTRLMPIVEEMMSGGAAGAPPQEYTYDLHDVVQV
jgi:quinol monooxygenase YgiN